MSAATWRSRTLGAALALLVQVLFLSIVMLSASRPTRPLTSLAHETILLLHALSRAAPATIDARETRRPRSRAAAPIVVPVLPPFAAPSLAAPSGIAGFGQALFGCAPERYADLPPDQRAHCPKPGEGMARNDNRDLGSEPRSHAKYEAHWQEQWTEDRWVPAPCLPGDGSVVQCQIDQAKAERARAQAAWERITEDEAAAARHSSSIPPPRFTKKD